MLDPRYRIREFRPDDYEAEARLQNRLTPDRPVTVESLRFDDEYSHRPPMVCRQRVVEEQGTGRLVGMGGIVTPPDAIGLGTF